MEQIHHLLLDSGFDKAMLYTADGAAELANGSLPELPAAINFGTGSAKGDFATLEKARPNGPKMCSEYWPAGSIIGAQSTSAPTARLKLQN